MDARLTDKVTIVTGGSRGIGRAIVELAAFDDDEVRDVLDTNIGGAFNVARAVVPHMIVQRAGKIINVSSVAGEKGGRGGQVADIAQALRQARGGCLCGLVSRFPVR